jgi:hypothetical protein
MSRVDADIKVFREVVEAANLKFDQQRAPA